MITIKDIFSFDKNLKIKLETISNNDLSHPGFKQFIKKNDNARNN